MGTPTRSSATIRNGMAVTLALAVGTIVSAILSLYAVAPDGTGMVESSVAATARAPVASPTDLR